MLPSPPRAPDSVLRTKTLAEIAGENYSTTDYGLVDSMKATSMATMERNFGTYLHDWTKKKLEERDVRLGEVAPVTQEEYDESPAARLGLEFRPNENPRSFQRRVNKKARLKYFDEVIQGQDRMVANTATAIATGLLTDPTNLVGFGAGAQAIKGAMYANAGRRAAATYHSAAGSFKSVLAYGAAFEVPYAYMSNDLGVEEYTFEHLKMSAMMNVAFAGVLGGASGYMASRRASKVQKTKADYQRYESFMEGDSPTLPAFVDAAEVGARPIRQFVKQNSRLVDIAEGRVKQEEITTEDFINMSAVVTMHEKNLVMSRLSSELANNFLRQSAEGKERIRTLKKNHASQMKRVSDAILFGKTEKLTDVDIKFLEANDILIREAGDGGAIQAKYVLTKDYGVVTKADASVTDSLVRDSIAAKDLEEQIIAAKKANAPDSRIKELSQARDETVKRVKDVFGETYSKIVEDANKIANEVLFGREDQIPARISKQPDVDGLAIGWSVSDDLVNYVAEPHIVFADAYEQAFSTFIPATETIFTRVMSTMFHESWHNLAKFDITSYNKLLELANSEETVSAMRAVLDERGYRKFKDYAIESPSHLLEFALTRPAFWKTLRQDDPKLFEKYKNVAAKNIQYGASILKEGGYDALLKGIKKPEAVAAKVAESINELRMKSKIDQQLRGIYMTEETGAQAPVITKKAAYENPNFKSRAAELDKFNADTQKYLEEAIEDILGDSALTTRLEYGNIPPSAKDRQELADELIETILKDDESLAFLQPYARELIDTLNAASFRRKDALRLIRKRLDEEGLVAELSAMKRNGVPLEDVQRIGFILMDDDLSVGDKLGRINQYFEEERLAVILRTSHDAAIKNNVTEILKGKKTPAAKMAQLKTLLDGSLRKGVERDTSIQRKVDSQIIKDQSPLIEFLVKNDMLELFFGEDPTKYMSSYRRATLQNPRIAKIYGENLKEGSLQLHLDLMEAMTTGAVPLKWKGVKEFEELVEIIQTINKGQMAEINHLGVNMRQRKRFGGYSMKYDREVVASMTKDEFVAYMTKVLDADQTKKLHGGVMEGRPTQREMDAGKTASTYQRFNLKALLEEMYEEVVSGRFEEIDPTGNVSIVGGLRKSAKFAYKDEFRAEALIKFSNFENLGRLLLDQIRGRSEKIALVKNLGHDPYGNLVAIAQSNGLQKARGYKILDATAKQVTGKLDNPADALVAAQFQKVRQFSNVLFLAGSGLSALSDIPLTFATLQYLSGDVNFNQFIQSYKDAVSAQFGGNNKEMAAWFRSQGAGFDLLTRTVAQRVVTGDSQTGGILAKANDIMFELNGLNRVTATHQQLFMDIITNSLGEQLSSGNINPTLMSRMLEFGFTDKEIQKLAKYVEEAPDGKLRLGTSTIPNAPLQRKLSGFYLTYMKEAVMEPDAGAQAITRLGLESGTITGETARVALQYSSFMLGMSRVVYRRFMHGYRGEGQHNAMKMAHLVTYVGAALAFAYMTTVLKDLSKFKEPINPANMTTFEFTRILRQSGILGITELGLNAVQFGGPATLSPVGGIAAEVLYDGDVSEVAEPLTGQQYPIIGPVIQKAIGFVMGETTQEIENDLTERAESGERPAR